MADFTIPQGKSIAVNFDATNYGVIDAFQVELGRGNSTKVKFRYPATTGFKTLTKVGNVYTANLLTAITSAMLGTYDLELTAFVGVEEVGKDKRLDFMYVENQNV